MLSCQNVSWYLKNTWWYADPTTFKCLLFSKTVIDDNCFSFDGVMEWFNAIERRNDYVIASFYQIAIYTVRCTKMTKTRDIRVSILVSTFVKVYVNCNQQ